MKILNDLENRYKDGMFDTQFRARYLFSISLLFMLIIPAITVVLSLSPIEGLVPPSALLSIGLLIALVLGGNLLFLKKGHLNVSILIFFISLISFLSLILFLGLPRNIMTLSGYIFFYIMTYLLFQFIISHPVYLVLINAIIFSESVLYIYLFDDLMTLKALIVLASLAGAIVFGFFSHNAVIGLIAKSLNVLEKMKVLAYSHPITHLPNGNHIKERINRTISEVLERDVSVTLFGLDINDFNKLNRNYGFEIGNELLKEFAARLKTLIPSQSILGHVSGSTFLFYYVSPKNDVLEESRIIGDLFSKIREPFYVKDHKILLNISVGITSYPNDGNSGGQLISNALGLLVSSQENQQSVIRFNEKRYFTLKRQIRIEELIEKALDNGEFHVYLQPKISLVNEKVIGAEALTRWMSPELGKVMPDEFVPIIEKSSYLEKFTEETIVQSIGALNAMESFMDEDFSISVNISPAVIHNNWLIPFFRSKSKEFNHMERLELELTEGILLGSDPDILWRLQVLKDMGFILSVDDFGTGYSNLRYLQKFPLDYLKIDREFIANIKNSTESYNIIKALVSIAQSLNFKTVAEGVEFEDQESMLKEIGCDYVQGFYYGKAMPLEDFKGYYRFRLAPASKKIKEE